MKAVVHIHIGEELPEYFWKTVAQTRRFHTGIIYLVIPEKYCRDHMIEELKCIAVSCQSFENTEKIEKLKSVSFLNKYGLGDFWHVTMQRLFVLEELMIRDKISEVLHLENDVTIYFNPENMFPVFHNVFDNTVAVVPLGPSEGCTAALMYVGEVEALKIITGRMIELLELGEHEIMGMLPQSQMVHEMMLLGIIQSEQPEVLKTVPVLPQKPCGTPTYRRAKVKLLRPVQKILDRYRPLYFSNPETFELTQYFEDFNGIFDPASIGQFLGGMPPPHKQSNSVIHKNHWIAPDLLSNRYSVIWKLDEEKRRCPYLRENFGLKREWKIFNLHVHNKKIEEFV